MKQLTILRHAEADSSTSNITDFERPLTAKGRSDAFVIGKAFQKNGFQPDSIITSPALRAATTAQVVINAMGLPETSIMLMKRLYSTTVKDLIDFIQCTGDQIDHLMLFGHDPAFSELKLTLCGENTPKLHPCQGVSFELDTDTWADFGPEISHTYKFFGEKNLISVE